MNKPITAIPFFIACLCLSISACAQEPAQVKSQPCSLSSKEVSQSIDNEGAKAALVALYGNYSKNWDVFLGCVATGDIDWLKIAVSFRSISDAGISEGLDIAVGKALVKDPENVLRATSINFDKWGYCGMLDYDDPKLDSKEAAAKALDKQKAALEQVHDKTLKKYVDACRAQIEK